MTDTIYKLSEIDQTALGSNDDSEIDSVRLRIKTHCISSQKKICCYCKTNLRSTNKSIWNLEHFVSKDEDDKFEWEPANLAASCIDCNLAKGTKKVLKRTVKRYPRKPKSFRIVHPYYDVWDEHIIILGSGFYKGLSPEGTSTILVCKLDRFLCEAIGLDRIRRKSPYKTVVDNIISGTDQEAEDAILTAAKLIEHGRNRT